MTLSTSLKWRDRQCCYRTTRKIELNVWTLKLEDPPSKPALLVHIPNSPLPKFIELVEPNSVVQNQQTEIFIQHGTNVAQRYDTDCTSGEQHEAVCQQSAPKLLTIFFPLVVVSFDLVISKSGRPLATEDRLSVGTKL